MIVATKASSSSHASLCRHVGARFDEVSGAFEFFGKCGFIGQGHPIFGGEDLVGKTLRGVTGQSGVSVGAKDQTYGRTLA